MKIWLSALFMALFLCGCIPIYKPWNGDKYFRNSANRAIGVSMKPEEEIALRALINGDKSRKNAGLANLLPQEKLFFDADSAIYDFYKDFTFEELKQAVKKYEPQDENFFNAVFAIYEYNFTGAFFSGSIKDGDDFECFEAKIAKRFFFDGEVLYLTSYYPGLVSRTFQFKKNFRGEWELASETDVFTGVENSEIKVEYDAKDNGGSARFYLVYDKYLGDNHKDNKAQISKEEAWVHLKNLAGASGAQFWN